MYELVPDDFEVPAGLEHERFRLRMLTVDDVVKDFERFATGSTTRAVRSLRFAATVSENLVDLGWHQNEFALRRSFAYTVVAPDESRVLGCVYLYPSETYDVLVKMWVRRDAWNEGLDPVLEETVRAWVGRDWPFMRPTYGERDR